MTLGGLALAVGILVDDATVEIENIHRNLGQGKPIVQRHSGWRHADRRPRLRFHALHLHRVRAGDFPHRRGALPVHAAGAGRGAGHDGLVSPFAHPGPHHGAVPAGGEVERYDERRRRSRTAASIVRRSTTASSSGSTACATATATCWHRRWRIASWWPRASSLICAACLALTPFLGHGFLPAGGCRPDPPARARPRRHAHRRDRAVFRPGGRHHPPHHPAGRDCRTCWTTSACPTPASTSP